MRATRLLSCLAGVAFSSCVLHDFERGPELGSAGAGASSGGTPSAGASSGGTTGANGSGGSGAMAGSSAPDPSNDDCIGVVCDEPPANTCLDAARLLAYDTIGSCQSGQCSYASNEVACECAGTACTSDPCATVTCETPPNSSCVDPETERKYVAMGTCEGGSCDYDSMDVSCSDYQTCFDGMCRRCTSDTACGKDCTPCEGETHCVDRGDVTTCEECIAHEHCPEHLRCGSQYTCTGSTRCSWPVSLYSTCGDSDPNHQATCCAYETLFTDDVVFNRSNDAAYPATLSNFTIEAYEVTVGRFRQFVAAYPTLTIQPGRGANVNNSADAGWQSSWDASLPASQALLIEQLKCDGNSATWMDEPGVTENKPINCVTWLVAYAFCVWEGKRLPTELEWNYAAAGGDLQTVYPWVSSQAPSADANRAAYNGYYYGSSTLNGQLDIAPVGAISGGYNRYGLADMAGNVAEWVLDVAGAYPTPCNDCARVPTGTTGQRVVRGGSWSSSASNITTVVRPSADATLPSSTIGFRCAGN